MSTTLPPVSFPEHHHCLLPSPPLSSPPDVYKKTLRPIVSGSSVVGITFKDGIIMTCDTRASYGNMCRYLDVERMAPLGDRSLFCSSGEFSDFQFLRDYLNRVHTNDWAMQDHDGNSLKAKEYASLMGRLLYNKRSRFNPLWCSAVVAGVEEDGERFLGYVDMYGTAYEEQYIATGLGRYFALTLLREQHRPDMSEQEARDLLESCMKILFYRDTQASNRIQIATVTAAGVRIDSPKTLDSNWNLEGWTQPTSSMTLAGCSW